MDGYLITGFEWLRIATCTDAAAATLLVYDYILTVPREIDYIWSSKWSVIKIMFLITRYLPFSDVSIVLLYQLKPFITPQSCEWLFKISGWLIVVGIAIAETILAIRTWALWERHRNMTAFLVVLVASAVGSCFYVESIFLDSARFATYPHPATPGCILTERNSIIAYNFATVIFVETVLILCTLYKVYRHYDVIKNYRGIASILLRDGVSFYFYLLIISITNLIVIVVAPLELSGILSPLQRVLHSALTTRVILNIREASERELTLPSLNMSRIIFFAPVAEWDSSDTRTTERNMEMNMLDRA